MASIQIPNLPAVVGLDGTELFEGVQAGTSVKISLAQMIAATRGGLPTTLPIPVSLGGTGVTTSTGTVSVVLSNSPALTGNVTVTSNSSTAALTVTQTGAGNAFVVEDSTSPDSSPFVVDAAGNVGIGTLTPTSNLQIYNANTSITTNEVAAAGTGVASTRLKYSTNHFGFYVGSANALVTYDYGAAAERMRIDASGNVLIGTTSPTAGYKFEVAGSAYASNGWFSSKNGASPVYVGAAGQMNFGAGGSDLILGTNSAAIRFGNTATNTELMRIDTSGNVGIGVTPSAWGSVFKAIELGTPTNPTTALGATNGGAYFSFNTYFNASSQFVYKATQPAAYYAIESNVHKWNVAPSGTINTAITFTQAMTLNASGNLGIGTTSPSGKLHVESASVVQNLIASSGNGVFRLADSPAGATRKEFTITLDNTNNRVAIEAVQQGVGFRNIALNPQGGNIGVGTYTPDAASIIDAQSTTKGVRFPNMTTAQKTAMANVAGNVVFDTTLGKLCVNSGSGWQTITSV